MPQSSASWLQQSYPWTKQPLIINAPMASLISPRLAAEVTRAGGLGFLGCGLELKSAGERLVEARRLLGQTMNPSGWPDGTLAVGIGVLCFVINLDDFVEMVRREKPAAVWLFAAKEEADYGLWASRIREACGAHIWIQTNSVTNALNLARTAKPDVLVLQGTDAGGHGPVDRAGIISLIPETADTLAEAGFGNIPLIAAGGIADGRGTAAALALGALGVVLGTRFLAAEEIAMPDKAYQKAVLEAKDGGHSTTKSKIFDEVQNIAWPQLYDGRALTNVIVKEAESGVSIEDARKRYAQDKSFKDSIGESRGVAWAGTAVGLVNKVETAAQIVTSTRDDALRVISNMFTTQPEKGGNRQ